MEKPSACEQHPIQSCGRKHRDLSPMNHTSPQSQSASPAGFKNPETCPRPRLIDGGLHVDARGTVGFVNTFDLKGVDRFYWIVAREPNVFRGWIGHRRDQKWFSVLSGTVEVFVVKPDDWKSPCRHLATQNYLLTASKPQVLHVPAGYATGSMDKTGGSILVVHSSGKIEQARTDEFRWPAEYWPLSV